jgi:Rrf2 family protein
MKVSRKADYALRAVKFLSGLPSNELGSINEIAEIEQIPREFLAKILKELIVGGLLTSYRGVAGAYRVSRRPRLISFLEVIEAVDGPIHLNICTEGGSNCPCDRWQTCAMRDFWVAQERQYKNALSRHTFGRYRMAKANGGRSRRR